MQQDSVIITHGVDVAGSYGAHTHYDVTLTTRNFTDGKVIGSRVTLEIRADGRRRFEIEMPGDVALALYWAVTDSRNPIKLETLDNLVRRI